MILITLHKFIFENRLKNIDFYFKKIIYLYFKKIYYLKKK